MLDTDDVVRLLATLVNRVDPFDSNAALRLKLLADAIKSGDASELDTWAAADLPAVINPDSIVARFQSQQLPSRQTGSRAFDLLRSIRNLLLFLPVILTCYSLALAVDNYTVLLNARPDKVTQPFLYLWQQGFGAALPSWLTFSSILWIDVLLLSCLLLLTIISVVQRQVSAAQVQNALFQQQQAAQELHADLVHALAAAALYLARHKRPLTAGDNLERVARRIDATARKMEDRFEGITLNLEGLAQSTAQRLEGLTANVTGNLEGLAQNVTKNFAGMTQNIADRFEGMTQNVTQRLEGLTANVTGNVESMTSNVTRNFADMTQNIEKNFAGQTQNVTARFDGMAQSTTTSFDTLITTVSDKYDAIAQQVMHQFGLLTNQMLEQMLEGSKYLKSLGSLTSGVVQTAEQMSLTAATLKETNAELILNMRNLIGPATDLSQQQEVLIATAAQSLDLLQHTANTMVDLGKKQDRWGTDLRNILDTLDLTIERATELTLKTGDFTSRQDTFLTQMQQAQQAQTALATLISDSTEQVKDVLRETTASARSLSSMATDMHEMMRLQVTDNLHHDTLETIQRYANAAQAIEKSSGSLDSSAGTLRKVGQQLAGVIQELEKQLAGAK